MKMKNLKSIILLFLFVATVGCGYTPLFKSQNINFYINELNFEGDRQANNYIFQNLKKYKKFRENSKRYDLNILTKHENSIANKDESGNPKNYNIQIDVKMMVITNEGNIINKNFKRSIPLSAQNKKLDEIDLKKKHKKNLSELISEDIIYFLRNQ
tara:strand:- start:504 stop:971 length:468 start_codon:yes stop_codon:yes gene_type:complete